MTKLKREKETDRILDKYVVRDEFCLKLEEYAIQIAIDKEIAETKAYAQKWIESGIITLHLTQKIPSQVLQDDREICRYPASNWQWLKKFIPFMKPKYKVHTVREHITFPSVNVPPSLKEEMRVFWKEKLIWGNK